MSSSPVLALDIDGVISLAQPGSATPWYASLQADWGFDHEEMARDFFRRDFLAVLRGRVDLHVALHGAYHRGLIAGLRRDAGAEASATDFIVFVRGAPAAPRTDAVPAQPSA